MSNVIPFRPRNTEPETARYDEPKAMDPGNAAFFSEPHDFQFRSSYSGGSSSGVVAVIEPSAGGFLESCKQGCLEPGIDEAKSLIKRYFEHHHGEIIDYADLLDHFEFPLPLIVRACEELEEEGKIAGVD